MNTPAPLPLPVDQNWLFLKRFFIYRLLLSTLLPAAFLQGYEPKFLGSHNPELFLLVSTAYFGLVLISGLLLFWRSPGNEQQAHLIVFVDIVAITLLMHTSGGITTGLGMLLVASIAFGSAIMRERATLAFAATATITILGEQVYADIIGAFSSTAYTQAGLLGAAFFAMAVLTDILAHRLRESEQLASQRGVDLADLAELNDYVIRHMQVGIIVVDTEEQIRLMNAAAWRLLGRPDAGAGQPLAHASKGLPGQLEQWERNPEIEPPAFQPSRGDRNLQSGFTRLGGETRAGTLIFLDDAASVSRRAQQMKLASLGRLTASIAHEIRNPLGAISHAEQLLRESTNLGPADRRLTEIIQTHSDRVNTIIEDVLQLSRRQHPRVEEILLQEWLQAFATEFRGSHKLPLAALQTHVDPDDTAVEVDPGQLHRIITNLCENAVRHFTGERKTLRIRIEGGILRDQDAPFAEIIDNGPGIPTQTTRQIFEPFFTTHATGTGLGLYIAKELSEFNQLGLRYTPVPTGGSCFHISFPVTRAPMTH